MSHSGKMFDFSLIPGGWNMPQGKLKFGEPMHATMFWPDQNYRVSWDNLNGDPEPHWNNQNLPKKHPDRHNDPRAS